MPINVKLETVVFTIFYLALFGVLIVPLQKLINSPTAFEEIQLGNKVEFPSITICPLPLENVDTAVDIKDFNQARSAIEKAEKDHHLSIVWEKPYRKL